MTASIGDTSNASYVFDGGSTHPAMETAGLGQANLNGAMRPVGDRSVSNESSPASHL